MEVSLEQGKSLLMIYGQYLKALLESVSEMEVDCPRIMDDAIETSLKLLFWLVCLNGSQKDIARVHHLNTFDVIKP